MRVVKWSGRHRAAVEEMRQIRPSIIEHRIKSSPVSYQDRTVRRTVKLPGVFFVAQITIASTISVADDSKSRNTGTR